MNAIIYLNSNGRVFIKRIAEIEKAVVFKIQFVEGTMIEWNNALGNKYYGNPILFNKFWKRWSFLSKAGTAGEYLRVINIGSHSS